MCLSVGAALWEAAWWPLRAFLLIAFFKKGSFAGEAQSASSDAVNLDSLALDANADFKHPSEQMKGSAIQCRTAQKEQIMDQIISMQKAEHLLQF